jgi:hypothetical protein
VGDVFTDDEIDDMLRRLTARFQRLKRGSAGAQKADKDLWEEAWQSYVVERARDDLIDARLKAASALAGAKRKEFYAGHAGDSADALQTLMVGSEKAGARRGFSVDAQGKAAEVEARSRFTQELDEVGALSRLADPFRAFAPDRDFEDEVAREVARLNGEERAPSKDEMARKVAEAVVRDQQRTRQRMNRLGAWIGELPGYISRTMHDPIKISGGFFKGMNAKARELAKARWIEFVQARLHERTFEAVDESALTKLEEGLRAQYDKKNPPIESQIQRQIAAMADAEIAKARREFLAQIWTDIVSGYRKGASDDVNDLDGFTPPASLARSLSRRRVLHWADADSWIAYNREFGSGSLFVAHLSFLGRSSRTEALMRTFGPAPEAAFMADRQRLTDAAREKNDIDAIKRLKSGLRQGEFDQLTGAAEMPESHRVATVSRAIRTQQGLAKLGGMIFSSVTDLGNGAQALSRAGVAYLDIYSGLIGSVAGMEPVAKREVANLVGEGAATMAGDIAAQFVAPDANLGWTFKAQRLFYRMNLFGFWQARIRAGAASILAHHLGGLRELAHGALDEASREALVRYGIDADAWDLLRANAVEVNGKWVITPDSAEQIAGDAAAKWAGKKTIPDPAEVQLARQRIGEALDYGVTADATWAKLPPAERKTLEKAGVTPKLFGLMRDAAKRQGGAIGRDVLNGIKLETFARELKIKRIYRAEDMQDAQRELLLRAQAYFTDQIDTAMTEPRARERAALRMGTRTGTAAGTALELFMQFKSFPTAVVVRHLKPAFAKAMSDRGSLKAYAPLAHFMMASTGLGYVATVMKDLARGLEPQPLQDENGAPNGKVFLRSFIQGGGAGIYGDFIFGSYDRQGRSPIGALGGPAVGELERLLKIFATARDGDLGDAAGQSFGLAVDNTPFVNLFYTRLAMNYLFLYQLQEAVSPGYMRRMEERLKENRDGQEFILPPSQVVGG